MQGRSEGDAPDVSRAPPPSRRLQPAPPLPVADGVAGFDADIVVLTPRDVWRFGYRIWSEMRTGMVVKTQTLDSRGRVLEQAAFSELQLNAPVQADKLRQMMSDTEGYRVVKSERVQTTAEAEGWRLKAPVPGFQSRNCYRRPLSKSTSVVQWIFTDGLATVSLFMEPFDPQRHDREGASAMGATHALVRRWPDGAGPGPRCPWPRAGRRIFVRRPVLRHAEQPGAMLQKLVHPGAFPRPWAYGY